MTGVTQILGQIEDGDPSAADKLLPLVYEELRKLAIQRLEHEKPGQTLQATALVHEAYLRLVDVEKAQRWDSRGHFFSAAAEAMRRILVERARRKQRIKHGGDLQRVDLEEALHLDKAPDERILVLDEALAEFEALETDKAELLKLRYFAGLSVAEAAEILGISLATAKRYWAYSRAWLLAKVNELEELRNS